MFATINLLIPDMFTGHMKRSVLLQIVRLSPSLVLSILSMADRRSLCYPDRLRHGIWETAEVLNYMDYCAKHRKLKPINSL